MKSKQFLFLSALMGAILTLQGCNNRSGSDVWEDTKSAGRHVQRGFKALTGDPGDSRQIRSRNDFECIEDENSFPAGNFQDCEYSDGGENYLPQDACNNGSPYSYSQNSYQNQDFIPLQDPNNSLGPQSGGTRPPRETPGDPGSSIPGIQAFRDPSTNPQLAAIFRPIYFEYNSPLVKGPQNLQIIHNIADFMRTHPNVYIFVEGHTDERGETAYNHALGLYRSNTVRDLLVNQGISPDRVFTITYGKDRPVVMESHEEAWSKNRRAEFKIYER